MEIQHISPPVASDEVVSLLWHKGPPWVDDLRRRLDGEVPGARDHFWLARIDGRLVAHTWYTVAAANPPLGLVGHVYTDPAYRRRGISSELMKSAMQHFLNEGGESMQLFTSTPYTVPFYVARGFENLYANQSYHETDWYMRYPPGSASLIDQWYHAQPLRLRQLEASDLPAYCLLYNLEFDTRLKDRAQEIGLGLEAELAFIRTIELLSRNQARCSVLANDRVIAGACSLIPRGFPHQAHVAFTDVYLHPAFTDQTGRLMQHCLAERDRLGVEKLIAVSVDSWKTRQLCDMGFQITANLPAHYQIGEQRFDCKMLTFE